MKKLFVFSFLLTFIGCFNESKKDKNEILEKTIDSTKNTVQAVIIVPIESGNSGNAEDWNKVLRQELLNSLTDLSDSVYIADRTQLEKIGGKDCLNNTVTFIYTSGESDNIEIKVEKEPFDPTKHKLDLVDTVYKIVDGEKRVDGFKVKNIIDGRYSYGIDGNVPKNEIKSLTIKLNGERLLIPDSVYSDLYEPNICLDNTTVEAYMTNKKNVYLYMACSDDAGAYSVKFIFDDKKYVTRIITTNEMTDGFDFLDGTAKLD